MAFGITRSELTRWKESVQRGELAFLTHYWKDERFPGWKTVTKVGCADLDRLAAWGATYGLRKEWIDLYPGYPHFDLLGEWERTILQEEGLRAQYERFYPESLRPLEQLTFDLYRHAPFAFHVPLEGAPETSVQAAERFVRTWDRTDDVRVVISTYPGGPMRPMHLHRRMARDVQLTTHTFEREEGRVVQYVLRGSLGQLDVSGLIRRACYQDVGRTPRFTNRGSWAQTTNVFFEHVDSHVVLHPYDDRGIEVIAPSETELARWERLVCEQGLAIERK